MMWKIQQAMQEDAIRTGNRASRPSYEHIEIFTKEFIGKAKSRKPGQPCQPGSKEEGL